jgi:hypothetical protein
MLKKIFILTCLPFLMHATELKPWYGNSLVLESRSKVLYQQFNKLATTHDRKYVSNDVFLTESLNVYLAQYAAEVEMTLAKTHKQHFNIDCLRLTGRYQFMDTVIDDPYSLVAGLTITQAGKPALYDPASFHHGLVNFEAHLSVGKEIASYHTWLHRYFTVLGVGISSGPPKSKPWFRADFGYLHNFCDAQQIELFINTLFGLGRHNLKVHSFRGYGPVRHQSVDLGVRYTKVLECGAKLIGEYSYRVWAKNFPKNANRVEIAMYYPLGLGF